MTAPLVKGIALGVLLGIALVVLAPVYVQFVLEHRR